VLMASAAIVLKHETSTLRQRHNFISIDYKFGVGDSVWEITSPTKFSSGLMSGRAVTWGQHIRSSDFFILCFFFSSAKLQPITVN